MNDDELPLPQLLQASTKETSFRRGGTARLSTLIVIVGLVLAGLSAAHYFGGNQASPVTPSVQPQEYAKNAASPHYGADLPVIPDDWAPAALARSNYSKSDQARILAALKRRDLSLVQMPIAEIDGKIGDTVRIEAGGFSQIVVLSDALKVVTLPIHHAGEVTISPVHMIAGNALAAGVMTVYGMYSLPTLSSSELVTLDVVAQ